MTDDAAKKLELLKLARTLVNEEYINRRAEEHNRWVHANDHSLKFTRMRAPYPPFTPYPSEDVIIAKAQAMYRFMVSTAAIDQPAAPTVDSDSEPEIEFPEIAVTDLEIQSTENLPQDQEETNAEENHVLPGWVKGWIRKP
jgi:hypothetical protein